MKDVSWLIKNTLKVTFKNKKNILLYLCTPLIGVFISLLTYGNVTQSILHVGIVNQDNGYIAADTVKFIAKLENVKASKMQESEVANKLTNGKLDCAIIVESGFSNSVENGNPGKIRIVSIKGAEITGFVKSYLYQYIDNVMAISKVAKGDQVTFEKMYNNYQQATFKLTANTVKDTSKSKNMTYQSVGFLIMIMLFSAGNFSEIILKEKENRTYFRLLSTPINARKYVLSNVVVNMIVLILQIIWMNLFIKIVFHIDTGISFWQMTAILTLFALVAVGLTLMLVSFANSSTSAGAIQNLVVTPSCLLAGCFWPVEIMPKSIQKVADFLPQRWVLDTISKLQQGQHLEGIYLNILILFAFAFAFFLIAIYKFGRNNSVKIFI
ncbi:ABC transporter permease [Neobacillus sp. PS3-40]|uniref:ABC transporter permease n=1 Tax=Neobacillus sp. PS3-40 TaxID=3070679 RepID=UPI0027DED646|nr:ABC transporter permease [Neobacillus sp. PS3-40]WML45950.1 ABC transporter permease [Neobacillus sp. PS3-40]